MPDRTRRRLLQTAVGVAAATATAALGGCLSTPAGGGGTESEHTAPGNLTAWDHTPDCETSAERDAMDEHYDSTIAVDHTTTSLDGGYAPIRFADLRDDERDLLDAVTTDGGHSTCDPSNAFDRFVGRVREHLDRQDDTMAYLDRGGVYYGLRVEVTDQGISY
ncbi:hypothetical protein [Halorubellus salinus]|uniref:hypothetical protein n=1 Tax=Halorubellus salinus TaxID=755309 RepID=UPI001D079CCE|nr:hypothetical protein [Halorubellus salinus]